MNSRAAPVQVDLDFHHRIAGGRIDAALLVRIGHDGRPGFQVGRSLHPDRHAGCRDILAIGQGKIRCAWGGRGVRAQGG